MHSWKFLHFIFGNDADIDFIVDNEVQQMVI